MDESKKSRKLWGPLEFAILTGSGIDIGCGPDPVTPNVYKFDVQDGDANEITKYVHDQFDFVYASHCLEHMHRPDKTLLEWWKLVKPGGHLFFMVPDEDLYEQGVFPSRFNPDHKATFTISKDKSWSPVSFNVLQLAHSLPEGQLVKIALQDQGYDRRLIRHGLSRSPLTAAARFFLRSYYFARRRKFGPALPAFESLMSHFSQVDQTLRSNVVAQIQCIVKKNQTSQPIR
ncbi:MAG: methyltransferase family protein [Verrucomicrobiales bacterium]|nr:methyltransferase family protein [Verrucomicrobiales bacterium]